jgi:serine protease Do
MKLLILLFFFPLSVLAQHTDITKVENAVKQVSGQRSSVVSIRVYDTPGHKVSENTMFSGVAVDTKGYILTSAHSMMSGQVYQVRFPDGKNFMARGLGRILSNDAGLIKITDNGTWSTSEMELSDVVKENELCIGISYAGSLGQSQPNVRFGYVAEPLTGDGSFRSTCLMEPGDSGGPVFNLSGKVIGIHSRIELGPDRNFEIPVATYRNYWKSLLIPKTYQMPPEADEVTTVKPRANIPPSTQTYRKISDDLRRDETELRKSVVNLRSTLGGKLSFALGTVVKPKELTEIKASGSKNYIVSKSSIVGDQPVLLIGNKTINAKIIRRNEARDLVLLEFEYQSKIRALNLGASNDQSAEPGKFLISAMPDHASCISVFGNAGASIKTPQYAGFLRASIEMKVDHVVVKDTLKTNPYLPSTLKIGDQLLAINNKEIGTPQDLVAETSGYFPGKEMKLTLIRDGKKIEETIKLSSITDFVFHIADQFSDGKSSRRYGFEQVFIHDGQLKPSECGGPVFDIQGNFCGINLARFSRTSTLAVPVSIIADFVEEALAREKNKITPEGNPQAQSLSVSLDEFVARMNLKYNPPSEMVERELPIGVYAPRNNTGFLDGPFYMLASANEDVVVAVGLLPTAPLLANPAKHHYTDRSHVIKMNYLIDTRPLYREKNGQSKKIERDSTFDVHSKRIKLYSGKILETYHADDAGLIEVLTDNAFQNKYNNLKIFFMYKRGVGEVYIQYFYNEGTDIDKYIDKTRYMLTFKP